MSFVILRNDKSIGFFSSFLVHAAFFALGGIALVKPVEYAVDLGSGGIEVSLTAAPAEAVMVEPVVEQKLKIEEKILEKPDPEDIPLPQHDIEEKIIQPAQIEAKKEEPKNIQTAVNSPYKGDGSSAIPGKDNTTFYSAGGAIAEYKPNYLKNPAPSYPWEAREKGWEGVVVLRVLVDKSGHPVKIEQEKSSGHSVLDESALKTVKKWRFRPAQLGSLTVESMVRVPIRFELDAAKRH